LKHLFQSLQVEANHHLFANDNCRGRVTLVFLDQFPHGREVGGNIADFKVDSSLREEGLRDAARRSAGLAKHDDFVLLHTYSIHSPAKVLTKIASEAADLATIIVDCLSVAPCGLAP
jgi:hypothetical protein